MGDECAVYGDQGGSGMQMRAVYSRIELFHYSIE
jgi:hypothetical protein